MTDLSRIRRHLLAGNDVCALDWDGSGDVIDGGKPIKRVAARVEELRQEGLNVVTVGKRSRMSVYRYVVDPAIRELRESPEPNPWKRPVPNKALGTITIMPAHWSEAQRSEYCQVVANQAQREWRQQREMREAA